MRLQSRKGSLKGIEERYPNRSKYSFCPKESARCGPHVAAWRSVQAAPADVVASRVWSMGHLCRGDIKQTVGAAWEQF